MLDEIDAQKLYALIMYAHCVLHDEVWPGDERAMRQLISDTELYIDDDPWPDPSAQYAQTMYVKKVVAHQVKHNISGCHVVEFERALYHVPMPWLNVTHTDRNLMEMSVQKFNTKYGHLDWATADGDVMTRGDIARCLTAASHVNPYRYKGVLQAELTSVVDSSIKVVMHELTP